MDSRYQVLKRDLSLEERRAFEDYLEEAEAEDSELPPGGEGREAKCKRRMV